jgi:Lrp/AsnC family leucine-responsive transcriptional regulator
MEEDTGLTLAAIPEVLEVHHVAGEDCYLLKVRARDAQHLGSLLRQRLGRIPGVVSTRTTVVLETVKETVRLPLTVAGVTSTLVPAHEFAGADEDES